MDLFCVGLSHHRSKVETLERFAGHAGTRCLLRQAGCAEALLLNTCNRVEVYAASPEPPATAEIARCLAETSELETRSGFYRYHGSDCVRHLFRVASGLDSMVIGETEILGQLKKAYEAARSSNEAGPLLHRLFQRAFRVAKQVRTHTEITRGPVSVSSVAVELAGKIFGDLGKRKVLILGAGEVSERTARALKSRGVCDLRVVNRVRKMEGTVRGSRHSDQLDLCRDAAAGGEHAFAITAAPDRSSALYYRYSGPARRSSRCQSTRGRFSLRYRFIAIGRRPIARIAQASDRSRGRNHRRAR
jgi:glutamyl-tRNA reductase